MGTNILLLLLNADIMVIGKSIPTRKTNTLTGAEPRSLSLFVESTKGTVRGTTNLPGSFHQQLNLDDDDANPFEEPKQDIFGIGYGV